MTRRVIRRRKVIVENTWTCSSCQHVNAGQVMTCAGCAHPKDGSETYRQPENVQRAPEVTDTARLREATVGPNWQCDYCRGDVRNTDGNCRTCAGTKPAPREHTPTPFTLLNEPHRPPYALIAIGGAVVLGFIIAMLVFALRPSKPKNAKATVVEMSWSREKRLERRTVVPGRGWRDNAPYGAYGFVCTTEKRGTTNCNPYDCNPHEVSYDCNPYRCNPREVDYDCDPYDCRCTTHREDCKDLGNGYSECDEVESCDTCYKTCSRTEYETCYRECTRTEYETCYKQCDVFGELCSYNSDSWGVIDRDELTGSGPDARWPDRLKEAGADERLGSSETYLVRFTERVEKNPRSWNHAPTTYEAYRQFSPGQLWVLRLEGKDRARPLTIITAEKAP